MKNLVVFLVLALALQVHSADFPFIHNDQLYIDCGVIDTTETVNTQIWFSDRFFTDSGKIKKIYSDPTVEINLPQTMTTLRYFPNGEDEKNCYKLPLTHEQRYIFRAGFYYGNYDGKSKPPAFDLSLGGGSWAAVNSSGPVFEEVIYGPKNDNISVCVVGKRNGGKPFISSLEATYLDESQNENGTIYGMMKNGTAYHLVTRVNFGYDQVIEPWSGRVDSCEERLNRYWMPQPMPGYTNLYFAATTCTYRGYENAPPLSVIATAISPRPEAPQSIYIPINFSDTAPQTAYVVLYFYQDLNVNGSETLNATRNMDIYVDGVVMRNVKLEKSRSGEVVTIYPVGVQNSANVTISSGNGTVLPPLLNGMEVFIAKELDEQGDTSDGFKVSCSFIVVSILRLFVGVFLVLG